MRTAFLFFPLWLGYILTVDGLVLWRTGTSLLRRSRKEFLLLFLASAPVWCLFEVANARTQNWEYLGNEEIAEPVFLLLCALNFSTVIPAMFETAELVRTFSWMKWFACGLRLRAGRKSATFGLAVGIATLGLLFAWPVIFYWLLWISWYLIFESLNVLMGRPHLMRFTVDGDWRPCASLALGALVCGFFWELWNYASYPKWVYHTPGMQFLHVFEMPLLGYAGYVPFAWELFALKNFFWPRSAPLRL